MNRFLIVIAVAVALCGCGGEVAELSELERMKESAPIVGQLPLELTPDLRAAGAIGIAAYNGPWVFRRNQPAFLHAGDLLQVDVVGVPGLERTYLEYINEDTFWTPEGIKPLKCRKRTQQMVAAQFPACAGLPQASGLRLRVFGPYSTDSVMIGGEVRKRGFYLWNEDLTLRRALTRAGGVVREMPAGRVLVVRGDRVLTFLLHDVLDGGTKPFPLKPLDAVSVMERIEMKFDARQLRMPPMPPVQR